MPTIPCSGAQNCLDAESPVANLSAEGVDVAKCFRYAFTESSAYTCEFDLSLCTAFAAFGGDVGSLCSPPPSIINGTNPPAPIVYSSAARSCTVDCGDFTSETYTVVAGTFVATSQGAADEKARLFACQLAAMLCTGPLPPLFTNTAQSCTVICPNNTNFTYTTPAGFFSALSQAEANLDAYLFACDLAALLCSGLPPGGAGRGSGTPPPVPQTPLYGNTEQECSATCANGSVFTFTAFGNTFLRESRDAANAVARSYACQQANQRRSCLSDLPGFLCIDEFSGEFVEAVGMAPPVIFSVSDDVLPPGITFDADGFWQGIPTTPGDYSFQLTAVDSDGSIIDRLYNVTVGGIDNVVLTDAVLNTAYSEQLTQSGLAAPATWAVVDGALPDGITLDSASGLLDGTPTSSGISAFTIAVTDGVNTCSRDFTLNVTGTDFWAALIWSQLDGVLPATLNGGSFSGSPTGSECGVNPVFCRGFMNYTGPAVNCNINGFTNYPSLFEVRVYWDWTGIADLVFSGVDFNGDQPFVIPLSAGEQIMVQFTACLPLLTDPTGTSGGTLTVIP